MAYRVPLKSVLAYRVLLKSKSAYRMLFIDLKCPMSRMVAYFFIVIFKDNVKTAYQLKIYMEYKRMGDFALPHFKLSYIKTSNLDGKMSRWTYTFRYVNY